MSIQHLYRNSDYSSIANPIAVASKIDGMQTVGDRVKLVREELGWKQDKLAKKAGMKQNSLSDLETGKSKETPQIVKLAVALKVSAYWLDSGKGARNLGDIEQAVLELDDADQKLIMDMIRAMQARKAA